MKRLLSSKGGFTLVELLVVTGILGLVIGAIYSLYLTHMRATYAQDEVVEVQQNLRIALDAITRDLNKGGAIVPLGTAAVDSSSPAGTLLISTCEPTEAVARISENKEIQGGNAFGNFNTKVDDADSLDGFEVGDPVRIVRPFDGKQPLAKAFTNYTTLNVKEKDTGVPSITLIRPDDMPDAAETVEIRNGDLIAKKSDTSAPVDKIRYSIGACPTGSGLSESCLYRTVNGEASVLSRVVATNISSLQFDYITENPYGTSSVVAVRVTIEGATRKKVSPTDPERKRELTSIVKLRNRRSY